MMEKAPSSKISLIPSPMLFYRFNPPHRRYSILETTGTGAHLLLDLVSHLREHRESGNLNSEAVLEIYDSLAVLGPLLEFPNYKKLKELYELDWSSGLIKHFDSLLRLRPITSIQDWAKIDPIQMKREGENLSFDLNLFSPFRIQNLDPEKVSKYPNLRAVIEYLEQENESAETKKILAMLYTCLDASLGLGDKAISAYEYIRKMSGLESYDFYNLATLYLAKGLSNPVNLATARKLYEEVPELYIAKYNLGITFLAEGNYLSAIKYFEELSEPCDFNNIPGVIGTSQMLDYVIKKFSCNNLGICIYKTSRDIERADYWIKESSFWSSITEPSPIDQNRLELMRAGGYNTKRPAVVEITAAFHGMIGESREMLNIYKLLEKVAPTKVNVLITGETGTGKELIAKAIHELSGRKGAFVPQDCGSISESLAEGIIYGYEKGAFTGAIRSLKGIFEEANGGTLFLDEVANMNLHLQEKFLRVLQEQKIKRIGSNSSPTEVDVRVISATNENLETLLGSGEFREDLYYRLKTVGIHIPPLRDRISDIEPLARFFVRKYSRKNNLRQPELHISAIEALKGYFWPGNIRQLESVIQVCVVTSNTGIIYSHHIQEHLQLQKPIAKEEIGADTEDERMIQAWEESGHDIPKTLELLNISRSTFYRKAEQYGIKEKLGIKRRK